MGLLSPEIAIPFRLLFSLFVCMDKVWFMCLIQAGSRDCTNTSFLTFSKFLFKKNEIKSYTQSCISTKFTPSSHEITFYFYETLVFLSVDSSHVCSGG